MAARNSRPTSGAKRANRNTQGAGRKAIKTSPRGNRPKARTPKPTGASRSKKAGQSKIPRKVGSPKTTVSASRQPKASKQNSRTAYNIYR